MPGAGGTMHRDVHGMGSKYPRSMRGCLPPWTLTLEVAFILIFFFFTEYDNNPKDHRTVGTEQGFLQDVTIMAALGLGFLTSSLRRFRWSSVAFNFLMLALGVQWAVLVDGFLDQHTPGKVVIELSSVLRATMSAMSVLISAGAVLRKANPVQFLFMVLLEVTTFGATRHLDKQVFLTDDHLSMMHIHVFAAHFGLTVAWCLSQPLPKEIEEEDQRAVSPNLFAMLGTLCLWIFWPSFNSVLLSVQEERKKAVFNTYYALAASAVTAISVSALAHPQGKINMTHIHNAVLAGGVAMSVPGYLISYPWIAMVLGLVAGLISIVDAKCLPVCSNHLLGIQIDTCGVSYTFGSPGLLGGITYIVLMMLETNWPMTVTITLNSSGTLSLYIAMGLASGLLTGLLLNLRIWRAPRVGKYFDDQAFWEFPHLAVGF
ncbi:blood group Rh(CE) polypeptide [Artibeus jamaicensis]|uniref:blood group Rh(CE) polypeptide n=1 Tax=Artibeus jamaicensis TaxID=9417 RepID=UPI00235A8446|nr:blood group Rh(CE) polypeptide [Artibeus jamaicensis]